MIKELIKLADHLDQKGLHKEADYVDALISIAKKKKKKKEKFPDHSGDGKITKKDILMEIGVIPKPKEKSDEKKKSDKNKKSKKK